MQLISYGVNSLLVLPLMRFILGFLSGIIGMLAGWFGLAALVIALAGPDRDGGVAMGAFFNIGPIGGLVGFAAGVLLFVKIGIVSQGTLSPDAERSDAAPAAARTRVSPTFAVAVLLIAGGLAWWAWYELIRSPYLTYGFMTLQLQFRLPSGMALPPDVTDVHISVEEGRQPGIPGCFRADLAAGSAQRSRSHARLFAVEVSEKHLRPEDRDELPPRR